MSTRGLIYYSDCRGDPLVLQTVRDQIVRAVYVPSPLVINEAVAVTLQPLNDPHWTQCVALPHQERGYLTMFRQILTGLAVLETDVVFHCEHDVLYSPTHFDFVPPRDDTFYYNQHTWRVDAKTGQALFYRCSQVSGLCASRALLIDHYRRRIAHIEAHGFERSLGFEPGTNRRQRVFGETHRAETWMSEQPNVDIKTRFCLTPGRWSQDQFRNKNTCLGWTMADAVPGWGVTKGRFREFLADLKQQKETAA